MKRLVIKEVIWFVYALTIARVIITARVSQDKPGLVPLGLIIITIVAYALIFVCEHWPRHTDS